MRFSWLRRFAKGSSKWTEVDDSVRSSYLINLLDRFELVKVADRMVAARSALYILQGVFGACELEEDQLTWARHNVYLCIRAGFLQGAVNLLLSEIDVEEWSKQIYLKSETNAKTHQCVFTEGRNLRVILSILYIMVETVRDGQFGDEASHDDAKTLLRANFIEELGQPVLKDDETTLAVVLFGMVHRFCSSLAPHFPIRKTILLLWKVNLVTLGPIMGIFAQKNEKRRRMGLPPLTEDTHQIIRRVRASSPPPNSTDVNFPRGTRLVNRQSQGSQKPNRGSLAGGRQAFQASTAAILAKQEAEAAAAEEEDTGEAGDEPAADGMCTPRPSTPTSQLTGAAQASRNLHQPPAHLDYEADIHRLPWRPKVQESDIEHFLANAREKYIGLPIGKEDCTSLAGLPHPIHDAVKVLRDHLYVPIGQVESKRERKTSKYPLTLGCQKAEDTPTERLYRVLYTSLSQYMIALLKVLLAAAPTSRTRLDQIDILAEVLPRSLRLGADASSVFHSTLRNIDVTRHTEIIVKAISALLLLLMKHFKLNHIYQYENMAQHLVFANCIPLILKFFNQNVLLYVHAKNSVPSFDFPAHFIGQQPEPSLDLLNLSNAPCCWRNMFACVNLMRILCKICKWKQSRIIVLVAFKSAPILKRVLKVRHAMLQLYVLKLVKMQSRYFGRQWRKNNMSIMSAIYQKVRHRLADDWAYGNDVETRPSDLQDEENTLRWNLEEFHTRRYTNYWLSEELRPVDNNLASVLAQDIKLPEDFKRNYEAWLEEEVFANPIDWDQVLAATN